MDWGGLGTEEGILRREIRIKKRNGKGSKVGVDENMQRGSGDYYHSMICKWKE
jgi:hypothetical protein